MQRVITLDLEVTVGGETFTLEFSDQPYEDRLELISGDSFAFVGGTNLQSREFSEKVSVDIISDPSLDYLLDPTTTIGGAVLSVVRDGVETVFYKSNGCVISMAGDLVVDMTPGYEDYFTQTLSPAQYPDDYDNEALANLYEPVVIGSPLSIPMDAESPDTNLVYKVHSYFSNAGTYDVNKVRDQGAPLTEGVSPDGWSHNLVDGTVTLTYATVPNGTVVADVTGEKDANGDPCYNMYQWAEVMGIETWDGNWGVNAETPYTAMLIAAEWDQEISFYGRSESAYDVIVTALQSCSSWLCPQGIFRRQLEPHGRVTAEVTEGDIISYPVIYADEAPGLSSILGFNKNYVVYDRDNLAGVLSEEDKDKLSIEYRKAKTTDQIDSSVYPAVSCISPSLITNNTAAKNEIEHRGGLYKEQRKFVDIKTNLEFDFASMGDMVRITYPRHGLDGGTPMQVQGISGSLSDCKTDVTLWGTPRYWPDAFQVQSNSSWLNLTGYVGASASSKHTFAFRGMSSELVSAITCFIYKIEQAGNIIPLQARVLSDGRLIFEMQDDLGVKFLDIRSSVIDRGVTISCIFSIDTATQDVHLYVDDEDDKVEIQNAANASRNLAGVTRWCAYNTDTLSPTNSNSFKGVMQHIVDLPGRYYDLDLEANRRLFFDKFNRPANTDWSSLAQVYLPNGDPDGNRGLAGPPTNRGGGTGDARVVPFPNVAWANKSYTQYSTSGASIGSFFYLYITFRFAEGGVILMESELQNIASGNESQIEITASNTLKMSFDTWAPSGGMVVESNELEPHKWHSAILKLESTNTFVLPAQLYIDDVDELDSAVYVQTIPSQMDTPAWDGEFSVCPDSQVDVGDNVKHCAVSSVMIHGTSIDLDLSDADQRRRFSNGSVPAYHGFDGTMILGEQPDIYLPDGKTLETTFNGSTDPVVSKIRTPAIDSPTDYETE